MLSTVDLYRANIPARYGGRTTSVLDVKVKNPYIEKLKLSGGLGLVSSRLAIETPIIKDKLMLTAGGRAGLTDFLLPIVSERLKDTKARFYDATLKILYLPTADDQISFTGFFSKDFYQLDLISKVQDINAENNQYEFKTLNGTLNWTADSISIASGLSAGLFRILLLSITTVSAVTIIWLMILCLKYSAFFSARYRATCSTGSNSGKSSSTSGFSTVNVKPASRIRYCLRGELEARISGRLKFIFLY
jgi:hypothetical protein